MANLNNKFMIFCDNSKYTIPVALFAGILLSILFVPNIADKYGRRNVYCTCLAMGLFAQLCLIVSDNYTLGRIGFFILGFAWPGKLLVGLQYILEFYPQKSSFQIIAIYLILNSWAVTFMPTFYEHIARDIYPVQFCCLLLSLCGFCFAFLFLPESPVHLYNNSKF